MNRSPDSVRMAECERTSFFQIKLAKTYNRLFPLLLGGSKQIKQFHNLKKVFLLIVWHTACQCMFTAIAQQEFAS